MEVVNSHASSLAPVANPWEELMFNWSVIFLLLLSMTVQIVLVFGGGIRHRIGYRWLNFLVWVCYMVADFVATTTLSAMIHYSSKSIINAIWACVVIVHLGGPDTITAYSVPDSHLWLRHCFNLLYQSSVAAYVVYVSAVQGRAEKEWNLLAAAALIFIVGVTKYGERAWALWLASPSQIVSSAQPIYNYMKTEHALGLHIDNNISDDEIVDVDRFDDHEDIVDKKGIHYQYIVGGEEWFPESDNNGEWVKRIVTVKDVWEYEGEHVTDNYMLCVSHALFKMYKRRFASLRFHEADLQKTKRFFLDWHFNEIQIYNILEIELKFMYDYLFSKSSGTAFSRSGIGMRVVNISLLGLCWFLLVRGLQETEDVLHGQRIITYILICVAVGLEVFQLGRIMVSDWSMVWLICTNIRQSRELRWWGNYSAKIIQGVLSMVGCVRKAVRGKYWKNQIQGLCVLETCFRAGRYSYPLKKFIKRVCMGEFTAWNIKTEFLEKDSKNLVLYDSKDWSIVFILRSIVTIDDMMDLEKGMGWEHKILAWHVATTVCERLEDQSKIQDEDVKGKIVVCGRMSRYFAYLLVTCPELLPVDAENAKRVYREVFSEMIGENGTVDDFCKNFKARKLLEDDDNEGRTVLRMAQSEIEERLEDSSEMRWREWAKRWLKLLQLCGMYDKVDVHGGRLTVGGEFLSLLWVLMGHMGRAEESYKAIAMKTDPRELMKTL